jgi:hypothetical protein
MLVTLHFAQLTSMTFLPAFALLLCYAHFICMLRYFFRLTSIYYIGSLGSQHLRQIIKTPLCRTLLAKLRPHVQPRRAAEYLDLPFVNLCIIGPMMQILS